MKSRRGIGSTQRRPALDQIEGRHPVLEAIQFDRPIRRLLIAAGAEGAVIDRIRRGAKARGIRWETMEPEGLARLASTRNPQGVIAFAEPRPLLDSQALLARAQASGEAPFLLLLDGVQDPQNFGSMLRTSEAAGVHGVVIHERRAAGLTPAVIRAAAGATEYVPVAQVTNLVRAMRELKAAGLWLVGADAGGDRQLWEAPLDGPIGVVVGGEGSGLSRLVAESCDFLVRIPMAGRIASLNAGVAAAIVLFEAVRQRRLRLGTAHEGTE